MALDIKQTRDYLQDLDFENLFNELGWSRARNAKLVQMHVDNALYTRREIAELAEVPIFEIASPDGKIPDARLRKAIHKEISARYHENLLIFLDAARSQSLWYWVKRDGNKSEPRDHLYVKGQPGDLSLGKLEAMVFDLSDFDENGNVSVLAVANHLKEALDVERVTKRFYEDFKREHQRFLEYITGIENERDRRWYASVLLNRLMFIYFLQRKGSSTMATSITCKTSWQQADSRAKTGSSAISSSCSFSRVSPNRKAERYARLWPPLGKIVYLNGGLFLQHQVEQENPKIDVPDEAFENLFDLFAAIPGT